jgi:hypothetical protein
MFLYKNRNELFKTIRSGVGVEIGVANGENSLAILAQSGLELLYSIDPWSRELNEPLDAAHTSTVQHYLKAIQVLRPFTRSSIIWRLRSDEAVHLFADQCLDFIYIDGSHVYEDVSQDLRIWYPKVKPGGLFCGHDYSGNCPGVVRAVDQFLRFNNLNFSLTEEDEIIEGYIIRSWIVRKPDGPDSKGSDEECESDSVTKRHPTF